MKLHGTMEINEWGHLQIGGFERDILPAVIVIRVSFDIKFKVVNSFSSIFLNLDIESQFNTFSRPQKSHFVIGSVLNTNSIRQRP